MVGPAEPRDPALPGPLGRARVVARFTDGLQAVVLWEVDTPAGPVRMCDHFQLADGLLERIDTYYRPPDAAPRPAVRGRRPDES